MILKGRGAPAEPSEALGWIERAAEQGYAAAQAKIATTCT